MNSFHIFDAQRRNYVTQNNIIKNKAGIGASQNGVTSLFLHPRPHFLYLQNSDKMQRITHYVKWRESAKFKNVFVSNTGIVRNGKTILNQLFYPNKSYAYVIIKCGAFFGPVYVHLLVWDCFSEKQKVKGYEIHHKDFNPKNNNIDNLDYLPKIKHYQKHGKCLEVAGFPVLR